MYQIFNKVWKKMVWKKLHNRINKVWKKMAWMRPNRQLNTMRTPTSMPKFKVNQTQMLYRISKLNKTLKSP